MNYEEALTDNEPDPEVTGVTGLEEAPLGPAEVL